MKNNIIKYIALIITFIFTYSQSIHAQELEDIKRSRGGYIMNSKVYLKKDMKVLFKDSRYSMDLYKKARKQRIVGHISLGLGATSTTFGLLLMNTGANLNRPENYRPTDGILNNAKDIYSTSGKVFLYSGLILGTVSLIEYQASNRNYKKALQEYSLSNLEVKDLTRDDIIIKTKVSGNGIGLTYNF